MRNKKFKVQNSIDGRITDMTEDCFNRQRPKLHRGTLYPNNGFVKIESRPAVSGDAAKIIKSATKLKK